MGAKKTKVLLVTGALVIFVLLYIAPKTMPAPAAQNESAKEKGNIDLNANLEVYLNMAIKNLDPVLKQSFDKWTSLKKYDSVVILFDKLKRPDLASHFVEKAALQTNSAQDWVKAGNRYYYSVQFMQDKTEIPVLYSCAIRCFKNALAKQPANVDAKIMLASCFVEGTDDPMKGITLLKEVEKTDSNNVKLQLAFAFFSIKSGQDDKAISRFNKVLQVDSTYIEAYLHLADIYEKQNNKQKAMKVLQEYANRTGDVTVKLEVNKYIDQLKLNTN